jgi:5-formyltetrahydrofolate cyclo-ligase
MHKKELRLHYKSLRAALSEQEIEEKSMAIANQLLRLNCWDKTYYHLFLTIEELKEVDTEFILQILAGKDKEIVIAKSDFETRKMRHFLLTDNTKIKKNEYNIPEPMNGLEVHVSMIEVVFVPLLTFDKKGHRIGYGKGFYDQFLAECNPETIKIGLSFFEAEDKIEDIFESDIPLNYCVTPSKIYQFD